MSVFDPTLTILTVELHELRFEVALRSSRNGDDMHPDWTDYDVVWVDLLPFSGNFKIEKWPTMEQIEEEAKMKAAEQAKDSQ